jgi:hypothetical protein
MKILVTGIALFLLSAAHAWAAPCMPNPSSCGYPDITNTGPRVGISAMRRIPQDVTSGPGWVWDTTYHFVRLDGRGLAPGSTITFERFIVNAEVDINTNQHFVRMRDNMILNTGDSWGIMLRQAGNISPRINVVINNNEIGSPSSSHLRLSAGIKSYDGSERNTIIQNNRIHGTTDGIHIECGTIRNNYIYDLKMIDGDHVDGIQSDGGATCQLNITHNTVINPFNQTGAINIGEAFGAQRNRLISDNLIAGGGYSLYAGYTGAMVPLVPTSNIKILNNRFSNLVWPKLGYWGPAAGWYSRDTSNVWSGNVRDDNGQVVRAP